MDRLYFSVAKDIGKIPTGSPLTEAPKAGAVPGKLKSETFDPERDMVTSHDAI